MCVFVRVCVGRKKPVSRTRVHICNASLLLLWADPCSIHYIVTLLYRVEKK